MTVASEGLTILPRGRRRYRLRVDEDIERLALTMMIVRTDVGQVVMVGYDLPIQSHRFTREELDL
jgi:hypothetical protein